MQLENLLLALLRFEFFGKDLTETERQDLLELGEEESKKLFILSKKHDMAHVVGRALTRNDIITEENPLYQQYGKEQMLSVYGYENQKHELKNIKRVFNISGVPFVVLKGSTIRKLYPLPELRSSCDIDVLIKREDVNKAKHLLFSKLRYTEEERASLHDVTLHTQTDVTIELHYSLQEGISPMDEVLNKVWGYTTDVDDIYGDQNYEKELTGAFALFYLVAHTAYHFVNGGCGIKPFVDLLFMQEKTPYDNDQLDDLLKRSNLKTFYESMVKIAKSWFMCEESDEIVDLAKEYILTGGVYGTTDNAIAVKRAKNISKSGYFWSRIFMPYESLKNLYPVLNKHKWLFPFCQVARWFRALFGGKSKKFAKELKVSANVTQDQTEKLSKLFKNVGL